MPHREKTSLFRVVWHDEEGISKAADHKLEQVLEVGVRRERGQKRHDILDRIGCPRELCPLLLPGRTADSRLFGVDHHSHFEYEIPPFLDRANFGEYDLATDRCLCVLQGVVCDCILIRKYSIDLLVDIGVPVYTRLIADIRVGV